MRRISAQLIITNSGPVTRRAVITAEDDGTIISVEETNGSLKESQSVEFYNGVIVPGFINCHAHLELSHLKGKIPEGGGLADFIMRVRNSRNSPPEEVTKAASKADTSLADEGVVLCADICNTPVTFEIKKKSRISYLNLLEVFGIDPEKAGKRILEIKKVSEVSAHYRLPWSIVPHSVYAVSLPLLRLLKEEMKQNRVSSIHFLETDAENQFLEDNSGPLRESYEASGLLPGSIWTPRNHISAIIDEVSSSGNLILVHNTFAEVHTVREVNKRGNTFWCLCPGSNLYIGGKMPPVDMLITEGCEIVVGTDSYASNKKLSILSELKLIHRHLPDIKLEELIRWATINGARALGMENDYGRISQGMKPGLLLLQDLDLVNIRLLPETTVTRLL